jgi:murein DD-endopeptidase / murein LD-carboxypeptidase
MSTSRDIVRAARACIGAPFRTQGRDPHTGMDCIGLVVWVGRTLNLIDHDRRDYSLTGASDALTDELLRAGLVQTDSAQPGTVLLFRFDDQRRHLGITSDLGVIHAHLGVRRVVEHGLDRFWSRAIVRVFRYPNLAE